MAKNEKAPIAELIVGYIAAFLLWPVGLLIGGHLLSCDHTQHGIRVIWVSSAIGVVSVLGASVIGDDRFLSFALAGITIVLGISLLVQRRRLVGIALIVLPLILALSVAFPDTDRFEKSNRDSAQTQGSAEEKAEELMDCTRELPANTCIKRVFDTGRSSSKPAIRAAGLSE